MPRLRDGELNKYVTMYGKKVIAVQVDLEMEKKIVQAAKERRQTRQSFIMDAINEKFAREEKNGD